MYSDQSLDKLPTELLIKIFSNLKVEDLCHLRQCCKRFNEIIKTWDNLLVNDIDICIVTNQINEKFFSKCSRSLSNIEKIRISKNWITARYYEESLLFSKKKFIPFLQLSNSLLWISRAAEISCFERIYSSLHVENPLYVIRGSSKADIVNFKIKNDFVVSGLRDGTIWLKNLNIKTPPSEIVGCHNSDVNSVDLSKDGCTLVSASREGKLKLWKVNDGNIINDPIITIQGPDVLWKVSISDEENQCAVGSAGNVDQNSLFVYNMERWESPLELTSRNNLRGILDIRWDGMHTLWSCGYDTFLRRWDLRTCKPEQTFMDPCGAALYCLDYDYQNTVMTGAQMHGRVILWDIRQRSAVQMYFMESCKTRYNRSSPVYSLAFDSEFLFTATDQNLNILDFSAYRMTSNDYSFFLQMPIEKSS